MTIESDKYCRYLAKKRKLESKRKKLADAEYEFPAKTLKKLLFLILYALPAIVSTILMNIVFYYSTDNITSLMAIALLSLTLINGLFIFKKREKHLKWVINKLEKTVKDEWTKEDIENGLRDYKIAAAILSTPVVGIIIVVAVPAIVSIGFLLPTVITAAIFKFAKKEKHTLKSFFQVLSSMNPIKLKKNLVKTDLAIDNINKELKSLYEIIKNSPDTLNYLKNSSREKKGESILYEKLKRDMELKYEDEVFQFHLNKIGKTEIVNE
jgi:hypothetical protein